MTPEQEVLRGKLAQDALDNPVYADAYATIENALIKRWRESTDAAEREECHKLLGLLGKVKAVTEGVMRAGKLSENELIRKRNFRDRVKALVA